MAIGDMVTVAAQSVVERLLERKAFMCHKTKIVVNRNDSHHFALKTETLFGTKGVHHLHYLLLKWHGELYILHRHKWTQTKYDMDGYQDGFSRHDEAVAGARIPKEKWNDINSHTITNVALAGRQWDIGDIVSVGSYYREMEPEAVARAIRHWEENNFKE